MEKVKTSSVHQDTKTVARLIFKRSPDADRIVRDGGISDCDPAMFKDFVHDYELDPLGLAPQALDREPA